jgi:gluconolactonase
VPKTTLQDGGFITYDDRFWAIIGMAPTIEVISENAAYPFAHEAGVYTPSTSNIFITSSLLSTAGKKKIQISKVVRNETGTYSCEEIEPGISLANGGVNYKALKLTEEHENLFFFNF